jgi:hypothetical protein
MATPGALNRAFDSVLTLWAMELLDRQDVQVCRWRDYMRCGDNIEVRAGQFIAGMLLTDQERVGHPSPITVECQIVEALCLQIRQFEQDDLVVTRYDV